MTSDLCDVVRDFVDDSRQSLSEVIFEQEMILRDLEARVKRLEDKMVPASDDLR